MINWMPLSYLIACAMIQLFRTELTWPEIGQFAKICNESFYRQGIEARFCFSEDPADYVIRECNDIFTVSKDGTSVLLVADTDRMISEYIDFMSVDTLLIIQNIKSLDD